MPMAMAAMRAASMGPGTLSSSVLPKRFFFSAPAPPLSSTSRTAHRRLRAFPSSELTLKELNPSVDLLRKTAEAVCDFRKCSRRNRAEATEEQTALSSSLPIPSYTATSAVKSCSRMFLEAKMPSTLSGNPTSTATSKLKG